MRAPTAAQILAAGHDLAVECERCKLSVDMTWACRRIVQQGRADVPVDRLGFRCARCHRPGQARVRGEGDSRYGRPTIWPLV
jgi:hypothetical protein